MAELLRFKFPIYEICEKCGKPVLDKKYFCGGECEKESDKKITMPTNKKGIDKDIKAFYESIGGGACCSHCSFSTEQLAKWRGVTEEKIQKERDECNQCCAMIRNLKMTRNNGL